MTEVRVGQIWSDNDKRAHGRQIRVVEVHKRHAVVELVNQRGRPAHGHEDKQLAEPGRRTTIRLDRFKPTSTGYRLVQDVEGGNKPDPVRIAVDVSAATADINAVLNAMGPPTEPAEHDKEQPR